MLSLLILHFKRCIFYLCVPFAVKPSKRDTGHLIQPSDTVSIGMCTHPNILDLFRSLTRYRPAMPFGNRKKNILEDLSVHYCHNSKNITPSPPGHLKFHYLGILQSIKLHISTRKILSVSLKLKSTPNTLGCFGLIR